MQTFFKNFKNFLKKSIDSQTNIVYNDSTTNKGGANMRIKLIEVRKKRRFYTRTNGN